jgi:trehalose/maltose hydrolase-like predicted phosphorylase
MDSFRSLAGPASVLVALALVFPAVAEEAPAGFVLTTEQYAGPDFAPAFVGNGYLGARIPFDGQGYREKPVATLAEVQGLFGKGRLLPFLVWQAKVEARASLPVWSSLDYNDGSGRFALDAGTVRHYRQSLDLRTGTLSTDIDWVSTAGRPVTLHYDVVPDRALPHAALIRLRFTPGFTGRVTVTDSIDPHTGRLLRPVQAGRQGGSQYVDLRTDGLGVTATLASTLTATDGAIGPGTQEPDGGAAQQAVLDVAAGRFYEVLKTIGVAVASDEAATASPHDRAIEAAEGEARLGYDNAKRASDAAWAPLWSADIRIDGDAGLRDAVRASLFALLASARDDLAWAPSPGGLSNDGYMGHVFWDSESWMFPAYLATAPDIANRLLQYRIDRLPAALAFAGRTGARGARFPWESALSGGEVVAIPGYGHELHIGSDIALATWQYWLVTGDPAWLERAFPMLAGIADFWVSYSTANPDGSRSIRDVVPPDEDVLGRGRLGMLGVLAGGGSFVDDSAYTNMAARRALTIATEAAKLLGRAPDSAWAETAQSLRVPSTGVDGVLPEYEGYAGGPIKQADVTLLAYPWEALDSRTAALKNLDYYAPRTNPDGPSMTDAIHSIVASEVGAAGCAAYSFTRRSIDPFVRPPYRQFAETRSGGVLTFVTGAGGFLQEFLYGYTGLRWRTDGLWLDPSLPPQLDGVTLAALPWRGRTVKIEVRPGGTALTLLSGPPMRIDSPAGSTMLSADAPVTLKTRLPAGGESDNLALCRPAVDSAAGAEPAMAANDGSNATVWIGSKPGQTLTIDLGREVFLDTVTVTRPPALAVAGKSMLGPALATPVIVTPDKSAGEVVEISLDAKNWTSIGHVAAPGLSDVLPADGRSARYLRFSASGSDASRPLMIGDVIARERQPR